MAYIKAKEGGAPEGADPVPGSVASRQGHVEVIADLHRLRNDREDYAARLVAQIAERLLLDRPSEGASPSGAGRQPPNPRGLPVTVAAGVAVAGPPGDLCVHRALVARARAWQNAGFAGGGEPEPAVPAHGAEAAVKVSRQISTGQRLPVIVSGCGESRVIQVWSRRSRWTGIRALGDRDWLAGRGSVSAIDPLLARHTGFFGLDPAGPAPVPSLELAAVTGRVPGLGQTFVRLGQNRRAAVVHAVLSGLRGLGGMLAPTSGAPARAVSAAGTTEHRWLLDGLLRSLAARAESEVGAAWPHEPVPRAMSRRLTNSADGAGVEFLRRTVPGLGGGWCVVSVVDARTGTPLAAEWGGSVEEGARLALQAALVQPGGSADVAGHEIAAGTAALDLLDADSFPAFLSVVTEYCWNSGMRVLGIRLLDDPFTGRQPFAWGPVWLS